MVFILQRYIFRELIKIFALATVALTLILSLGSILRYAQEYGIGPGQVVSIIGYFLPITLTFVLPISALFACTLAYGRFAGDNELDACRASGISLTTLIYPGLVLAIIIAIANLLLSFNVVPEYFARAEKSVKDNAKQILFRNIQRKGYYFIPGSSYRIYADAANTNTNELFGVIVVQAKTGKMRSITTAQKAEINFDPHEQFNEVTVKTYNAYQSDERGDSFLEYAMFAIPFDSLLGDNIKFKKIDEMKLIRDDLMRFRPIAKDAKQVYAQFIAELLAEDINSKIQKVENNTYELYSDKRRTKITAEKCSVTDEKTVELQGEVKVYEYDITGKSLLSTLTCNRGFLHFEGDELGQTLTLELNNAERIKFDGTKELARRPRFKGLTIPANVTNNLKSDTVLDNISDESIETALAQPSPRLKSMLDSLKHKINMTLIRIRAEIHTRLVFGVGCIALILIGIGLGIMLRGGHLLTAFGASSIPAVILVVFLMMGKNLAKHPATEGLGGILLIWTGLGILIIMASVIYKKLLSR